MAKDVQEIVREKQTKATHMRDDIERARVQANQAHNVRIVRLTFAIVADISLKKERERERV